MPNFPQLLKMLQPAGGALRADLIPFFMSSDFLLSKVAFASALLLLLVLVRRGRPRKRVIFNF